MAYLAPADYAAYGLSADTADFWIKSASAMIDAHCRRSALATTSYTESVRVQRPYGTVQLTYGPVVQITAVQLRYAAPRPESEGMLASCATAFGIPGQWIEADPSAMGVDDSGQVTLPQSFFGLPYAEARVTYVAGFAEIPEPIKLACAQIVRNAQATPGLNVRSTQLDTIRTEYFSDSLLDSQVKSLLRPFVVERMG